MFEPLFLASGGARVDLAPQTGGAVAAFTFEGRDVMRPTPRDAREKGDVRAHACYPLVPYSNRIAHAWLAFCNREVALERNFGDHPHAIHGVGWQRPWRVAAHDATSALLAFEHTVSPADARAWPWPFRATQWFGLTTDAHGATLTAKLAIVNTGNASFPFGLGFHPFFPRTPATTLEFDVAGVWENDATLLPLSRAPIPPEWRRGLLTARRDDTIDSVFTEWSGTATLADPTLPFDIGVTGDRAARFVVVYAPVGRDFIAVEPVTHMTDAFNHAARGEAATGTRILAAGAGFSCTMRVIVRMRP